jgi:predicted nucleic acid-binding protein
MEEEARAILRASLKVKNVPSPSPGAIDPEVCRTLWWRRTRTSGTRIDPPLPETHEVMVLDTNVLSEALKPMPSDEVLGWLAAQPPSSIFTTTITMAEVLYGVEALPQGKRRTRLLAAVEKMFAEQFEGRMLPFDEEAARLFARIVASRNTVGRPISQHGCRDRRDYEVESRGSVDPVARFPARWSFNRPTD